MALSTKMIATLDLSPRQVDIGLLVLRLIVGFSLFTKHGWEKIGHISHGLQTMGDPIGVGHVPSFFVAMIGDGICSLLLFFGLFTRWAAIFAAFNVFVAWAAVHHFAFYQKKPAGDHGEFIVLYIAAFLCLFFTGSGRYGLDEVLFRRR